MTLTEMIEEYERLRARKDELKDLTKLNNEELAAITEQITDELVEEDKLFEVQGEYKYTLQPKSEWNFVSAEKMAPILEEMGEDSKFDVLRNNGFDYLITETVNARSMSSDINARLERGEEIPDDLAAILSRYDHNEIGRTKLTKKQKLAMQKAREAKKED